MPGKRARASAPQGPTVSGEVVSHCSDLTELLVTGLFDGIKNCPPKNGKEQKCNANVIATYRVLNSEFRSFVDARIIEEFTYFKKCADEVFDATYQLSKLEKKTPQEVADKTEIKLWQAKREERMKLLITTGLNFFPDTYARFYAAEIGHRSPLAADLSLLLVSVSNFMSIARERCFAHCCSGLKHCSSSATCHMQSLHTNVIIQDEKSKNGWKFMVYCRRDCFARACVNSSCMRHNPTTESKLAKEMFRIKGIHEHDRGDVYRVECHGDNVVKNPLLITTIRDMRQVDSLQNKLELDFSDVMKCKSEIRRKEAQLDERRKLVLEMERKFMMDDIDAVFKVRNDLFFDSLKSAEETFPLTVGAIRSAIANTQLSVSQPKTSLHGLDNRIVNSCLNQIAALMGPVRKADWKLYKDDMASQEAYDFMSGHTYPSVLPSMLGAADMLDPCATHQYKFHDNQIARALHMFDEYQDLTMESDKGTLVLSSVSNPRRRPLPFDQAECWERSDKIFKYMDSELAGSSTPICDRFKDKRADKAVVFADAFNQANSDAKTRPLALAMIGIFPRDLCKRASEE